MEAPNAPVHTAPSKAGRRVRPKPDSATVGKLFDRLPPHSLEAEMALLGSLILGPEMITDVLGLVSRREQFYSQAHGSIFEALIRTYDRHRSGDLVQLLEALRAAGVLGDIGGEEYLVQLADTVPSPANARHYARIVAEKWKLRKLIEAAGEIIYDAYTGVEAPDEGVREILDRAEQAVFEIAQEDQVSEPQKLQELLNAEIERIEAAEGKGISGISSGYDDLDMKLRGFQPGEIIIIAARPSMGKTALALNLAEQIAFGGRTPWDFRPGGPRVPVAVFSLEMTKAAVTQRLLSAYTGLSGERFRDGSRLGDEIWQRILHACNVLSEAPIYIDDTAGLTVMQLRSRARRLVAQHDVKMIMIDYLQLLSAPSAARESRQVEVSAISRQIKALARELEVPIICLSQLNRATEQREGNRPRLSDLRESGSIEQDADVVMLLHREEYYHINNPSWAEENPDKVGVAELIIAKQRNGPTGVVKLTWDNNTTRFKSYTPIDAGVYVPPSRPADLPPDPGYSSVNPWAEPKPGGGSFAPGRRTGPVEGHRDGGGPDRDDDTGAPF
ncbi:MAG: replicative DNA helicase [Phycisphaeraceae bacterium]|nr:replicative DNA helicase [Phycisphaeraceae bacterium]MCW5753681.1 replicative DNA helicase [Phycisphaeraceae bacterium]